MSMNISYFIFRVVDSVFYFIPTVKFTTAVEAFDNSTSH